MKARTKISWSDFTLNPWEGCTKQSPGCLHCYAENRNQRWSKGANWGKGRPRLSHLENAIKTLEQLNRRFDPKAGDLTLLEGPQTGERWISEKETPEHPMSWTGCHPVRPQVFSLSLGDILDPEVPVEWFRDWMVAVAGATNLEFLLLTKQPQMFHDRMLVAMTITNDREHEEALRRIWGPGLPNVAWGVSVEDEARNNRLDYLAAIPAARRFISAEPLLGFPCLGEGFAKHPPDTFHLVISGGESGVKARPMHPAWIDQIQADCLAAGIPHHFKQWGSWAPASQAPLSDGATSPGNIMHVEAGFVAGTGPIAERMGDKIDPPDIQTMHRTPGKEAIPPRLGGKIQQPRLRFA